MNFISNQNGNAKTNSISENPTKMKKEAISNAY